MRGDYIVAVKDIALQSFVFKQEASIASAEGKARGEVKGEIAGGIKNSIRITPKLINLGFSAAEISALVGLPQPFIEQFDDSITVEKAYDNYLRYLFSIALGCFKKRESIGDVANKTGLSKVVLAIFKENADISLDGDRFESFKDLAWMPEV
jgi:hypothetical protein